MWQDAGEGRGIFKSDGTDLPYIDLEQKQNRTNSKVSKHQEKKVARHYHGATNDPNNGFFKRIWKDMFTTTGITERLLRKTIRKNTWMYVSVSRTEQGEVNVHKLVG